ncbi:MAG: T9SS type A sorting domain-containing protein, partial [Chitinophagales bacterium]
YMQHMDENGNSLWDPAGEPLVTTNKEQYQPEIIADGDNGFYVIWRDERFTDDSIDFYMQHVDFEGDILWDNDGVRVSSLIITSTNDLQKEIVSDGEGGALIIYYGHTDLVETDEVIFAGRINSDGDLLWDDHVVCNNDASNTGAIEMVTDGIGGAFATWRDDRLNNESIAVQRFNKDGDMLWAENGIPITTLVDIDMTEPVAAFDGESGVYIAWTDWRNDLTQLFAQHVDENGNLLWPENGVASSDPDEFQTEYSIEPSSEGGAFITWTEGFPGESFAQKINEAGERLWGDDGLNVFTPVDDTEQEPFIKSDGFGGAVIAVKEIAALSLIKARNVKPDGTFNGDQVIGANSSESKLYVNMNKAPDNNWIFSWIEERVADQYHVYASKIAFEPYTTSINNDLNTAAGLNIYPNPNKGIFNLHFENDILTGKMISVFNIAGELVYETIITNPENKIELNKCSPGVYFVELITLEGVESLRVIIY